MAREPIKAELPYNPEAIVIEDDDDGTLDPAAVAARIRSTFASPSFQAPMLPAVALEVLALSQSADVTASRLARLLERDALLTGEVLRLARSAQFTSSSPVRTLNEAIVRLGIAALRNRVMEASLQRMVFRAEGFAPALDAVRRHATVVAHLCRSTARYTSVDAEFAFLVGLLHDVGISAAMVALAQGRKRGEPSNLSAVQWMALEQVHEEASGWLARSWQLPPEVTMAVEGHHAALGHQARVHPVVGVLAIAERLAQEQGHALVEAVLLEQRSEAVLEQASAYLRLAPNIIATLRKEAPAVAAAALQG
jgi:HD-like signal output (HDOD) protein